MSLIHKNLKLLREEVLGVGREKFSRMMGLSVEEVHYHEKIAVLKSDQILVKYCKFYNANLKINKIFGDLNPEFLRLVDLKEIYSRHEQNKSMVKVMQSSSLLKDGGGQKNKWKGMLTNWESMAPGLKEFLADRLINIMMNPSAEEVYAMMTLRFADCLPRSKEFFVSSLIEYRCIKEHQRHLKEKV